jgi:hypothetical protein
MPSAFCYHAKPGGGKSEDLFPGDKSEHPYSWLDDTEVTAMSADGRFILDAYSSSSNQLFVATPDLKDYA